MEHLGGQGSHAAIVLLRIGCQAFVHEFLRLRHIVAHVVHCLHGSNDDMFLRTGAGDMAFPAVGNSLVNYLFNLEAEIPCLFFLREDNRHAFFYDIQFEFPGFLFPHIFNLLLLS